VPEVEGVEVLVDVGRLVLEHGQVDHDARPGTSGAAAPRLVVARQEGVVEGRERRRNMEPRPLDGAAPLDLVDGHVDPGLVELSERAVEALVRDEPPHVAELHSGPPEEREIGALRILVDPPLDDAQEVRLAVGERIAEPPSGLLRAHPTSQVSRKR
jgi:hypothetical protein